MILFEFSKIKNIIIYYIMKFVVYSCLFSNNTKLMDKPKITDDNKLKDFDYVMFTNIPNNVKNTGWTPIYKDLKDNHGIYTAKYYKWMAHKYLLNYDISIYVDAYMIPNPKINWLEYINKLEGITFTQHNQRTCIYNECDAIVRCKKDSIINMNKVKEFLKSNNMPNNYGLSSNGLFLRNLKNDKFNKLCEELYNLMLEFTYRDQALLSYVFWKNEIPIKCEFTNEFCIVSGVMGNHNYV